MAAACSPYGLIRVTRSMLPPVGTPDGERKARRCITIAAWVGISMRSEEHTSELQSLMRISYAVFCLKKKKNKNPNTKHSNLVATTYDSKTQNLKCTL